MTTQSNIPEYTGFIATIFGAGVAVVIFFRRFKAGIISLSRFFIAVGQVSDMNARLLEVEKNQVTQSALDSTRVELASKIDRVENRLTEVTQANHIETMGILGGQWKKLDDFITTATFLIANRTPQNKPMPIQPPPNQGEKP